MTRAAALLLAAIAAPAVGAADAAIAWETLADGSQFYLHRGSSTVLEGPAWRCWRDARGFDCIEAQAIAGVGPSASRQRFATLPPTYDALLAASTDQGYRCSFKLGRLMEEEIVGPEGTVARQAWTKMAPKPEWARGYVDRVAASKRIGDARWFACPTLMPRLQAGGVKALRAYPHRRETKPPVSQAGL